MCELCIVCESDLFDLDPSVTSVHWCRGLSSSQWAKSLSSRISIQVLPHDTDSTRHFQVLQDSFLNSCKTYIGTSFMSRKPEKCLQRRQLQHQTAQCALQSPRFFHMVALWYIEFLIQHNTTQHNKMQCKKQCNAMHCITMQYDATKKNKMEWCKMM